MEKQRNYVISHNTTSCSSLPPLRRDRASVVTLLDNIAMLGSVDASASHLRVMLKGNKVGNFAMLAPSVATFPPNGCDIILFNALEFSALSSVMGNNTSPSDFWSLFPSFLHKWP
ncbi:unnamed protein product [Citrullus colocynthis]|uniref:Uncharacterized protein n=1 Tax=Citrullus colocynthis TaxID=252529 RepID=A0ABP0YGB5_9ROSI